MSKSLDPFLLALRSSGLMPSDLLDQVLEWSRVPNADPKLIAKQIVQKGWLSHFQVKMIWNHRGAELLLGQYVLVDKLGEGGMGEVYRARHRRMGRDVALKVIRKERLDNPEAVRRFQREIQAAAQLSHENVVMAYDADQQGDIHFFAMELVEGINLAKKVREGGGLSLQDACNYIRQSALGLQHALERGMVHRDVKPSNLILSKNGIIKVLDMGLARIQDAEGEAETRLTQEGLVIGTPDFIAPEQARNSRNADIRSDIYSLGCTFYFLLCAESPFSGGTPTQKMLRHTTDPIPDITLKRPDVSPALRSILEKMMAKNPQDRYQTPAEIAQALQMILTPPPAGLPASVLAPIFEPLPDSESGSTTADDFRLEPNDGRVVVSTYRPAPPGGWLIPILLGLGVLLVVGAVIVAIVSK